MTRAVLVLLSLIATALALRSTLPRADLVARQYPGGPPPPSNTNPPPPTNPRPPSNLTGDFQCGQSMCVSAVLNGSTVEYTLSANRQVGWMGIGFGGKMINTPMVVMWPNSDGSVTLSQRKATDHVMPTVDANPPRVATLNTAKSSVSTSNSRLVFTIEANADTNQQLIYALGSDAPSSSSVDATFSKHVDKGTLTLNLIKSTSGTQSNNASGARPISFTLDRSMIVAYAVLCISAILVLG